jgi:tetratricopeptide (TPR) repeat protein
MMAPDQSPGPHEDVVVDERRPWPGLEPFREADRRFFFGRGHEQEELLRSIRRGINMLLFGESGLGKTSLLQAGLFPRLRESGYLPVLVRLAYHLEALAPSDQVKLLLNRAIDDAGLDAARRIEPQETLWEYLHRREFALVDRSGEPIIPVIVFDQFEESFTLGLSQRKADCQAFLRELSDLMENRPPAAVKARLEHSPSEIARYVFNRDDYRIVIAMREDFLPWLEMFRASAPSLGRNRFRLTRLKGRQALAAVVEPGRGIVSEEVARRIVSLVGGGPANDVGADAIADIEVESSLLSLFCSELNERRLAAGQAQITAELVELSRRDILRSFYERALTDQPQAVREFIEDQLVTDSGARDSIARERAERLLADKGVRANVIDELVRRRLLHIEERRGGPRVELIHDVLLDIVRQGKDERSNLALRQALARTRRRYLVRAAAAVAIVTVFAGTVASMSYLWGLERASQAKKLEETNVQLAEQARMLTEQKQQLAASRDWLQEMLERTIAVLGKSVEPSEGQSLGDNFLDEQVRPLTRRIIGLADEMRGPGYHSGFMSIKAQSLVIMAKVATRSAPASTRCMEEGATGGCGDSDEGSKYIEEATQIVVELVRQGKTQDDTSKGFDAFDAIMEAWETHRNTELAFASIDRTIEILQQIGVLNSDDLNRFVGSAVLRQAGIMRKTSRFDDAEAHLRSGVRRLSDAEGANSLVALVNLYNNLGEVLLNARDRALDESTKRSAIADALIEFEHAWEKAVAYLGLKDTVSTRNWVARHAGRVAGLHEDIKNVEQARRFYRHQLNARRELVPLTIDVESAKRDLASALMGLGWLERTQGDKSEAIERYRECVTSMEALVGKNSAPANQRSLGFCYAGLADSLRDDGKRAEAIDNYQKALAIREKLVAAEPGDADRQSALAYVYGALADAVLADGRRAEALDNYQKALAIREKLAAAEPGDAGRQSALAYVYGARANALLADGRRAEALDNYQKSLAIREKLAGAAPDNVDRQRALAYLYGTFARALSTDGKRAEATANYQKALATQEKLAEQTEQAEVAANGKPGVATAERLHGLAWYALFAREFGKALGAEDRALGIALENRAHALTIRIQTNRAHALMFLRRVDEAQSVYLQYRGAKNVSGVKSWEDVIREDFDELREAGLSDPLMAVIEKRFAAGG